MVGAVVSAVVTRDVSMTSDVGWRGVVGADTGWLAVIGWLVVTSVRDDVTVERGMTSDVTGDSVLMLVLGVRVASDVV